MAESASSNFFNLYKQYAFSKVSLPSVFAELMIVKEARTRCVKVRNERYEFVKAKASSNFPTFIRATHLQCTASPSFWFTFKTAK